MRMRNIQHVAVERANDERERGSLFSIVTVNLSSTSLPSPTHKILDVSFPQLPLGHMPLS